MPQAIIQYSCAAKDELHLHMKKFLEVSSNFKIHEVTVDAFRPRLFSYALRDITKSWLISFEPTSIAT